MPRHLGPIVRTRALRRLRHHRQRPARALADALRRGSPSRGEVDWAARIEARRAELLSSDRVLDTPLLEYTGDGGDQGVERRPVADICRADSKPEAACRLLLAIVHELRSRSALELGSGLGISTAYQAAGMELEGTGKLLSIEASSARARIARETVDSVGLSSRAEIRHGRFDELLPAALEQLAPLEYAFVDGHHEEEATLRYWRLLQPHLGDEAIVLLDDIHWSEGMASAWTAIASDPAVDVALDLNGIGACVFSG